MNSGKSASAEHSWENPGTYNLTVRAVDRWDEKSEWSDVRNVTIGRTFHSDPTPLDLETVTMIVVLIIRVVLIIIGVILIFAGLLFIASPTRAKDVVIEIGIPMKVTGKYMGGVGLALILIGAMLLGSAMLV